METEPDWVAGVLRDAKQRGQMSKIESLNLVHQAAINTTRIAKSLVPNEHKAEQCQDGERRAARWCREVQASIGIAVVALPDHGHLAPSLDAASADRPRKKMTGRVSIRWHKQGTSVAISHRRFAVSTDETVLIDPLCTSRDPRLVTVLQRLDRRTATVS